MTRGGGWGAAVLSLAVARVVVPGLTALLGLAVVLCLAAMLGLAVAPARAQMPSGTGAGVVAGEGRGARSAAAPPLRDATRVMVDTRVADIIVDDDATVAVMDATPRSNCPSERYVFERSRAKWLNTTGRLIEARKEGALIRVSFSCVSGYQSINAIMFLSPPGPLDTEAPRRSDAIDASLVPLPPPPGPVAAGPGASPAPGTSWPPSATDQALRTIPLP